MLCDTFTIALTTFTTAITTLPYRAIIVDVGSGEEVLKLFLGHDDRLAPRAHQLHRFEHLNITDESSLGNVYIYMCVCVCVCVCV